MPPTGDGGWTAAWRHFVAARSFVDVKTFQNSGIQETGACFRVAILLGAYGMSERKNRVLLAEDEAPLRAVMVNALSKQGFDVLEAADGREAVHLLNDPDHVDAVVTDICMPGMDGVEVAQRAHDKHPDLPIIFASSLADDPDLPEPCSRLLKPYSQGQLINKVRTALNR